MSRLTDALAALRPGADFADTDGTLAGVRWDTPRVKPPSQAEIDAQMARLDCDTQRRAAYPPLADLADALVAQAAGDDAPLAAYVAACAAVKARYPKPPEPPTQS